MIDPRPARSSLVRAIALATLLSPLVVPPARAAGADDLAAGRDAARQCSVCHGKDGISVNPEAPNLAGDSSVYVEKQLRAYRSGERVHQQMSIIAQGLDDPTIEALAAWFEAMEVAVTLPEID